MTAKLQNPRSISKSGDRVATKNPGIGYLGRKRSNFAPQVNPASKLTVAMGVRVSLIYRQINKGSIDFPITPRTTSSICEVFEVVRDTEDGVRIHGLEISAAPEAQQRIQELADRLCATYSLTDFECIQRLGYIPAGEALMCVRTAAGERDQAMRSADEFAREIGQLGVITRDRRE